MSRRVVAVVIVAVAGCGGEKSSGGRGSGSGSAPAPIAVAPIDARPIDAPPPPPRDLSPYCGAAPCPCKPGTSEHAKHWSERCVLTATTTIQGIPCAAGEVEFHPDGALATCENPAAPITLDGTACGASWRIRMHPNHHLARCAISAPRDVGPYHAAGPNLALWEDGSFADGEIAGEVTLDGITCRRTLTLYRGGKLQSCQVAAAVTRMGIPFAPGDFITLRPDGTVKRAQFDKPTLVQGKTIDGVECFDERGKIRTRHSNECGDVDIP